MTTAFSMCQRILNVCHHRLSMNFELDSHGVAFVEIFCFSDARFDGHKVESIFGEQGSSPLGVADPNLYRNHSPAIRHQARYRFQVAALLRRNGHEVERGGASPEPNFASELDVHWHSISNAQQWAFATAPRGCSSQISGMRQRRVWILTVPGNGQLAQLWF